MSTVKTIKRNFFKNPHFWLSVLLLFIVFFLVAAFDFNKPTGISAQTQVVGEGTSHFLAKWVQSTQYQATLVITPPSASVNVGSSTQFTALYDPDGPSGSQAQQDVTNSASWSSSDASKATINSSGLATGVSKGSVTITASYSGLTATASLTVTVTSSGEYCWFVGSWGDCVNGTQTREVYCKNIDTGRKVEEDGYCQNADICQ